MYRALETERPDALFCDAYARRLAGARGEQLLAAMPYGRSVAWAVAVRTRVFDELILRTVQHGEVGTVLNLAAGLDTRPYRLPLPPALHWIEVDLPPLLAHKQAQLADAQPVCELEAVPLDLADGVARRALFARINATGRDMLVVTEAFLLYLPPAQVADLAAELRAQSHVRGWLLDLLTPPVVQWFQLAWNGPLARRGAQIQFGPAEGLAFFEQRGWRVREFRSTPEEAHRLGREPPWACAWHGLAAVLPAGLREAYRHLAGYVLLEPGPRGELTDVPDCRPGPPRQSAPETVGGHQRARPRRG
jgi:methyltransferase (TIGR00027 family)